MGAQPQDLQHTSNLRGLQRQKQISGISHEIFFGTHRHRQWTHGSLIEKLIGRPPWLSSILVMFPTLLSVSSRLGSLPWCYYRIIFWQLSTNITTQEMGGRGWDETFLSDTLVPACLRASLGAQRQPLTGLIQGGRIVACPSRALKMSTVYFFFQPSTSVSHFSCYCSYLGQEREADRGKEQQIWHQEASTDARWSNTCALCCHLLLCKMTHGQNCVAGGHCQTWHCHTILFKFEKYLSWKNLMWVSFGCQKTNSLCLGLVLDIRPISYSMHKWRGCPVFYIKFIMC